MANAAWHFHPTVFLASNGWLLSLVHSFKYKQLLLGFSFCARKASCVEGFIQCDCLISPLPQDVDCAWPSVLNIQLCVQ